ncbi:heat shock factor protein 1 isoform X2 [Strongylocentrotus purpuratus]|uniref:HSF-type DNA-binding domain-containing protein n=1 Tax=Strongylocentrotus purpuratus TaxID=7668 RepID=A0A7M7N4P6_STRPU|nr:heat shock factor protein 1 isoform X2 [Strongylocentrotus purpuratus]
MSSDETGLTGLAQGSMPQPSCPAFLSKLWLLVDDEGTDELIHWSDEGNSFIVQDQVAFAQLLLPQYFKHNNMASFIRQLNMYGFRKKAHLDDGALKTERTDIEFQHPHFLKGEIKHLEKIKRKVSGKDDSKVKTNEVGKILNEVREVKGKQNDITAKLETIKEENTALWREVVGLRQKHDKQQKIVNRLIHFLITLVQPKPKVGNTRKRPLNQLMIEGFADTSPPSKAKFSRTLPGSPALEELKFRDMKEDSNLEFLSGGDSPTLTDIIDNAPYESKVTELLEEQEDDLIPSDIQSSTDRIPSTQGQAIINQGSQDNQANATQLLGQGYAMNQDTFVIPTVVSSLDNVTSNIQTESVESTNIPVLAALSPDVTYPQTPGSDDIGWLDMAEDCSADGIGLEDAGVAELVAPTTDEVLPAVGHEGLFGPGEGQLVLTSDSPTNENKQSQNSPNKFLLQRMLSHEEQNSRQDLGDQLSTVQSNLNEFKQMITSNPTLHYELGELLNELPIFFDEPSSMTMPDALTNFVGLQSEDNGENDGLSSDVISTGNELVTYKPSTSSASLGSFMADDEDSLLRSLDDDSQALREQNENDGISFQL